MLSGLPEIERSTAVELKDGLGKNHCVAVIKRQTKSSLSTQEISKFGEENSPKGQAPTRIAFLEEFPEDDSGINKYKLRRDLAGLI